MSGSMSMPPGGPMPGGPMAGGGMPQGQLPPQVLAMLMQAARSQGGPAQAQSAGPMQATPPQAPGAMASPAAQMPSQQQTPAAMPGGMSNKFGAMAQRGRFGDTQMAHMTPGEIAVPPQVQTPQVLATLANAFKGVGADVRQFAAGSPFAAHNPDTGQQEFSIWSAILPVVGAVGGALLGGVGAPAGAAAGEAAAGGAAAAGVGAGAGAGVGTAGGAAIGGALGGAAGGAIDHTGPLGMLAGAAGGGLGGYLGMGGTMDALSSALGLGSGAAGATGPTANAISSGTTLGAPSGEAGQAAMAARMAAGDSPAMMTAGALPQAAAANPSLMQLLKGGMAAGMGSGIGQSLGGALAPPSSGSNTPPGFNQPLGPVNPGLMIGGRPAVSTPNFTGYNPYTSVTGSPYRFY